MDIFDLIRDDHRKFEDLLQKIDENIDSVGAKKYFIELRAQVIAHSRGEEDFLYAELEEHEESEGPVEHAEDEHRQVEDLLDEMSSVEFGSRSFRDKFSLVRRALVQHVREEEDKLFKLAQKVIDGHELEEMARKFKLEREKVLQEQHDQSQSPPNDR